MENKTQTLNPEIMKMAIDTARRLQAGSDPVMNAIRPVQSKLEFIEREMQRVHETIRILIQERESTYSYDSYLTKLQTAFESGMNEMGQTILDAQAHKEIE